MIRFLLAFLIITSSFFSGLALEKLFDERETANNLELHFQFDRRVETIYFVLMLSGKYDELITQHPNTYKFAAIKHFSNFKDHNAVKLAKGIIDSGFSFDYAVSWIFQFSDFPTFSRTSDVNYPFYDPIKNGGRKLNPDTLELFRKELIDFYSTAQCDSFFTSQQDFLMQMVSNTEKLFSEKNLPQIIEDYYGIRKDADFIVVLSPLVHNGGYGIDCDNRVKNKKELIALIGSNGEIEFMPVFSKEFLEQDLVIHEFGHSYETDIVDDFLSQTRKYEAALFPQIKEDVTQEGCGEWATFMHELIDRAVTIRIVENVYGKEAADELTEYEKSIGFRYVTDIVAELRIYEQQRKNYPTLRDFFPQIIKRLGQIKAWDGGSK